MKNGTRIAAVAVAGAAIVFVIYMEQREDEWARVTGVEAELFGALTEWHGTHQVPIPDLTRLSEYAIETIRLERFDPDLQYRRRAIVIGYDPAVPWGSKGVIMVAFYARNEKLLWTLRAEGGSELSMNSLALWKSDHPSSQYYVFRR